MAPTDYLKLRGRTWYVHVQIPANLRKAAGGKWEYIQTLKTGDLTEANRRKHAVVAAFKQRIAGLTKQQKPSGLSELYDKALAWRDAMERHKGEVMFYQGGDEDRPYYVTDEFLSEISDEANEFLEEHGEKATTAFYKVARGEGTLLSAQIDAWITEQAGVVTGQTISLHRAVLTAFLKWAGEGTLIEDVHRKKAGEYVSHLLTKASGLSRRTAGRYVSSLSSLWKWLQGRGFTEDNPWLGQGVSKKSGRGVATERNQWTNDALIKILTGSYTPRYTEIFRDLVKLALVTGARLDELCSLKVGDVQQREDGWWLIIREGKSKAALRDIPLHDSATHIVTRRLERAKTYLFEGLLPGGPDKKRSWHVSKAFGRYTSKLELGEQRQVFHALRNTFIEGMEGAEVLESTIKLIVGHARQSMTYGRYSKGQHVPLRAAINKLNYSSALMELIRTDLTGP